METCMQKTFRHGDTMNQVRSATPAPPHLEALDPYQREAATTCRNSVVTAGAGAGKTMTLVARYLHLVIDRKIPVESILALTFTRKAAAEMSSRIYEALAAQDDPMAKSQFARMVDATIMTLDSFCSKIVRQAAADYGYTADFTIDDERCAEISSDAARSFVLRNRKDAGIAALLEFYRLDEVIDDFFAPMGKLKVVPVAMESRVFSEMGPAITALAKRLEEEMATEMKEASRRIQRISREVVGPNPDCALAIAAADRFLEEGPTLSAVDAFSSLKFMKYARNDPGQAAIKNEAKNLRDSLAPQYLEFLDFDAFKPTYTRILELLDTFAEIVRDRKRSANAMDFKDLGFCAVDTLMRRKDIRRFWKERVRSIMIDEFQDDNKLQKDLLYLLGERPDKENDCIPPAEDLEEGKLFFVGDEKQSIYMFRNAEVSVFKALAAEFGGLGGADGGTTFELATNYRSTPTLINFFNELFARVMSDAAEPYDARYSPMVPPSAQDSSTFPVSKIECHLVRKAEQEDAEKKNVEASQTLSEDETLALEITEFIHSACKNGTLDVRENGSKLRSARYEDFAVLLRSTTKQYLLEKYLRLLDVPFESESPRSLFIESVSWDVFNILRLFLDPDDKNVYAAVLRGPLCRLSDQAFAERILLDSPIFEPGEDFGESDKASMERMRAFYAHLSEIADKVSVSEIVEYVWFYSGIRLELLSKPDLHPFLNHFDHLFRMASEADGEGETLSAFIEKLSQSMGSTGNLEQDIPPRGAAGCVRITTIHKAKGLQFPIVIIPWMENHGNTSEGNRIWRELPEGITVNLRSHERIGKKPSNIFYSRALDLKQKKESAEVKRLFYVACTRAMDHLFFWGLEPAHQKTETASDGEENTQTPGKKEANSFLGLLMGESDAGNVVRSDRRPSDSVPWKRHTKNIDSAGFGAAYARTDAIKPLRSISSLQAGVINRAAQADIIGHGYAFGCGFERAIFAAPQPMLENANHGLPPDIFGTLCHDMVEFGMRNGSCEGFDQDADIVQMFGKQTAQKAENVAIALAESFLGSEFWLELRERFSVRTEVPFIGKAGSILVDGRLDVLLENDREAIIFDFKTDIAESPESYALQLELYRRAFASILSVIPVRSALLWLSTGAVTWCKSDFPEKAIESWAEKAVISMARNNVTKTWYPYEQN
jgi:ATP-dependent exoDNAse (exonuclease V) beta subunit